jgi:predicted ATPase
LKDHFDDGVFFVSLAPLRNCDLFLSAVAQAFGVKEEGDATLIDLLLSHASGKHMLLILDNFEHLMSAIPMVSKLISALPQAKILVTSRERLHLGLENEFAVLPLALPNTRARSVEEISQSAAVKLFVDRAAAVRLEFALSEDKRTVGDIRLKLDGLPRCARAGRRAVRHTSRASSAS